ncbi:TonB family protein [Porphyromonas loveana]|uniref:TonB family protein n=7 Tax=Porphyromonas loveana TaxID=1884669 RepID=UPI0035A1C63A
MSYTFIPYLLLVSVGVVLFWSFERLILHANTISSLRRAYYLTALVSVWMLPIIGLLLPSIEVLSAPSAQMEEVVLHTIGVTVVGEGGADLRQDTVPWVEIVARYSLLVWLAGVLLLSVRLGVRLCALRKLLGSMRRVEVDAGVVYVSSRIHAPFSFWGRIYVPALLTEHPSFRNVFIHEREHVRQKHHWDVLLAELSSILLWFNPFVWLIRADLRRNLEYLADRAVLRSGSNSRDYQYELLGMTMSATAGPLSCSYNINDLKERIKMMNKSKSKRAAGASYLVALPLAALMLMGGNMVWANDDVAVVTSEKSETSVAPAELLRDEPAEVTLPQSQQPMKSVCKAERITVFFQGVTEAILPSFPGGEAAMMKFLCENLVYPKEAQDKGISGRVIVTFVVEEDGSLSDVQVAKSASPILAAEAVRVVRSMPKWIPAEDKGKKIAVRASLPVSFKLQSKTAKKK